MLFYYINFYYINGQEQTTSKDLKEIKSFEEFQKALTELQDYSPKKNDEDYPEAYDLNLRGRPQLLQCLEQPLLQANDKQAFDLHLASKKESEEGVVNFAVSFPNNRWAELIADDSSGNWLKKNLSAVLRLLAQKKASLPFYDLIHEFVKQNREEELLKKLEEKNADFDDVGRGLLLGSALQFCKPEFVSSLLKVPNIFFHYVLDLQYIVYDYRPRRWGYAPKLIRWMPFPLKQILCRNEMKEVVTSLLANDRDEDHEPDISRINRELSNKFLDLIYRGKNGAEALETIELLLNYGVNPLDFHSNHSIGIRNSLPLSYALGSDYNQAAITLLCEYGAGLITSSHRLKYNTNQPIRILSPAASVPSEEQLWVLRIFYEAEFILAVREKSQFGKIVFIHDKSIFKGLLDGSNSRYIAPQLNIIYDFLKESLSKNPPKKLEHSAPKPNVLSFEEQYYRGSIYGNIYGFNEGLDAEEHHISAEVRNVLEEVEALFTKVYFYCMKIISGDKNIVNLCFVYTDICPALMAHYFSKINRPAVEVNSKTSQDEREKIMQGHCSSPCSSSSSSSSSNFTSTTGSSKSDKPCELNSSSKQQKDSSSICFAYYRDIANKNRTALEIRKRHRESGACYNENNANSNNPKRQKQNSVLFSRGAGFLGTGSFDIVVFDPTMSNDNLNAPNTQGIR